MPGVDDKFPQWGRDQSFVTHFLNFGILSVCLERVKLVTFNVTNRWNVARTIITDDKLARHDLGHDVISFKSCTR